MADRTGQKLGNYTIVQLLGRGGFADVYLGEHIYLKTQAAVKVLQTRLSTPEDMDNFLREAQIVARLSHPHIVRVIDFGVDGEIPFLVMDYAPNGTLRQRHPRGTRLPLTTIVSYVKQLADALQHAHDEKLIHRDIKPANMLLGKRNEILLSDFGIALIAQSSRYQSTQDVAGTVAYMSPEQIQGRPRPTSDQYSLGIVVYEWVSGDCPFHGSFTELCTQHMFAPLPSLSDKVPGISPQVGQVIAIALAKDPKQRFASVQAFARALEQASQSAEPTVLAPRPEPQLAPVDVQSLPPVPPEEIPAPVPASMQSEAFPTPSLSPTSPEDTPAPPPSPPQEEPVAQTLQQQSLALTSAGKQVSVWSIRHQQIVAMIFGVVIYGIVNYLLDLLFLSALGSNFSSPLYQTFWPFSFVGFNIVNTLVGLGLIIPCFFGVRFGPWVGLATATFGDLLGNALSSTLSASFNPWYSYVTYAIFGIISGLAFVRTRGHYNTRGAIISVVVISIIGLIISLVWQSIGDSIFNPPVPFTNFYFPLTLVFCIPGLFLLSFVLSIYEYNRSPSVQGNVP